MNWNVSVDHGVCIGSGMCVGAAPDHFAFDYDEGVSRALSEEIEPDERAVDAAESCPVEAILVRAADGRLLAPKD